jgi:hypothetical protein
MQLFRMRLSRKFWISKESSTWISQNRKPAQGRLQISNEEIHFFRDVALLASLLLGCGRVESLALGFAPLSDEPVPARLASLPEPDAAVVGLFCLSMALLPVLVLLPPAGVLAGLPFVPSSFED